MSENPNVLVALANVADVVDVEDTTPADVKTTDEKFFAAAEEFIIVFEDACRARELDDWDLLPRLLVLEQGLRADPEIDGRIAAACHVVRDYKTRQRPARANLN
jgi:hypothetical protein